jgi:hypothetical protein
MKIDRAGSSGVLLLEVASAAKHRQDDWKVKVALVWRALKGDVEDGCLVHYGMYLLIVILT